MRRIVRSLIEWLRAGYPDDAPRTGYSPLLALMGPISLSRRQIDDIVHSLQDRPVDDVAVRVAITRVTAQLPTDGQTHAVLRALRRPT